MGSQITLTLKQHTLRVPTIKQCTKYTLRWGWSKPMQVLAYSVIVGGQMVGTQVAIRNTHYHSLMLPSMFYIVWCPHVHNGQHDMPLTRTVTSADT